MIVSLFAIAIFFEIFIEFRRGLRASSPDIPNTLNSALNDLFFFKNCSSELNKLIFLLLYFSLTFSKICLSKMIKFFTFNFFACLNNSL